MSTTGRGGTWWPVSAAHLCAIQGPRATVHAVSNDIGLALRSGSGGVPVRTVCGLDAFLLAHVAVAGGAVSGHIVATWPSPRAERCVDCAELTGVHGRQVAGSHSFRDLVPLP